MANLLMEMETEECIESRVIHISKRPIPFERFWDMAYKRYVELIDGVIVEQPRIEWNDEMCIQWLYQIMGIYV